MAEGNYQSSGMLFLFGDLPDMGTLGSTSLSGFVASVCAFVWEFGYSVLI